MKTTLLLLAAALALPTTTTAAADNISFAKASRPGASLVRLAREGVELERSATRHVAVVLGQGTGGREAATRGVNWNVRLAVAW